MFSVLLLQEMEAFLNASRGSLACHTWFSSSCYCPQLFITFLWSNNGSVIAIWPCYPQGYNFLHIVKCQPVQYCIPFYHTIPMHHQCKLQPLEFLPATILHPPWMTGSSWITQCPPHAIHFWYLSHILDKKGQFIQKFQNAFQNRFKIVWIRN